MRKRLRRIYFTNEVTDNLPWGSIVEGNLENRWAFDAAIIPEVLLRFYDDIDEDEFFCESRDGGVWAARKMAWNEKPWQQEDHRNK